MKPGRERSTVSCITFYQCSNPLRATRSLLRPGRIQCLYRSLLTVPGFEGREHLAEIEYAVDAHLIGHVPQRDLHFLGLIQEPRQSLCERSPSRVGCVQKPRLGNLFRQRSSLPGVDEETVPDRPEAEMVLIGRCLPA